MPMGQYNSTVTAEKSQCELDQKSHLCQYSMGNIRVVIQTIILNQLINSRYTEVTFVNQLLKTETISLRNNVILGSLVP